MKLEDCKLGNYADNIKDLPDRVLNSADELKAMFDGRTDKEVKSKHNALIDTLAAAAAAGQIGAVAPGGVTPNPAPEAGKIATVQGVLEGLRDFTNQKVVDIGSADMAQADYDNDGRVKAAGGIAPMVQQALLANGKGYQYVIHKRIEDEQTGAVTHQLDGPAGSSVVLFEAVADGQAGEAISINGAAVTPMDGGQPATGQLWASGQTVLCWVGAGATLWGAWLNKANVDDVTIESGSNANGGYIKFPDGTLVCTKENRYQDLAVTTQDGGIYRTSAPLAIGSFALPFVKTPWITATSISGWGDWVSMVWSTSYYVLRGAPATIPTAVVEIYAIGRWK